VDVLGVVTSMSETSSVKRKVDMSEFTKRDLTITDKRCGDEGNGGSCAAVRCCTIRSGSGADSSA